MSTRRKKPRHPRRDPLTAYQAAYRCGHCSGTLRNGRKGWGVYHDDGCPVLGGVVDPGAAGRRAAAAASEETGLPVVHGSFARRRAGNVLGVLPRQPAGPRSATIVEWFMGRMRVPIDLCPHFDADAEPPPGTRMDWAAWDRERLLCAACFLASEQRVSGTREDATCDYCRQHVPAPQDPAQLRLYALTIDLSPVTLHFGLCPACWEADHAEAAS